MAQNTTASSTEPTILGYIVTAVEDGWKADYQGEITDEATAAGVEKILIDPSLTRLRMKAIINRVKASAHEYDPEEDDQGQ